MLVVAAALIDDHGKCLMQQRPAGKHHGGLWEFPGGKVEPGEHPAAALVRELAEELAITVARDALVPLGFATDMPVTMLLYRCRRWTGTPRALAAQALRWDLPAALAALPMPPVDVPLLAALAAPALPAALAEPAPHG
ncbi:8-oxo-dGTP diphosphatase [Sphingomonas sp. BE138]|uniref:(deoxy)nucleoside triphosphate pyrophosphohydrolase n=1 Tax=Sphingomonas sp. BE138 TaxID=2817845 RepID=UPI002863FB90|nr:(deoxy)nucleoside triphosphate pyrophosphohydrolase [Sphingomonas sp. BE138]MDR6789625.1 8-oxo-dGTP diphosphatase [Sphingomonas sp. BE138]